MEEKIFIQKKLFIFLKKGLMTRLDFTTNWSKSNNPSLKWWNSFILIIYNGRFHSDKIWPNQNLTPLLWVGGLHNSHIYIEAHNSKQNNETIT